MVYLIVSYFNAQQHSGPDVLYDCTPTHEGVWLDEGDEVIVDCVATGWRDKEKPRIDIYI